MRREYYGSSLQCFTLRQWWLYNCVENCDGARMMTLSTSCLWRGALAVNHQSIVSRGVIKAKDLATIKTHVVPLCLLFAGHQQCEWQ